MWESSANQRRGWPGQPPSVRSVTAWMSKPPPRLQKALGCNQIFSLMIAMRAADWKHAGSWKEKLSMRDNHPHIGPGSEHGDLDQSIKGHFQYPSKSPSTFNLLHVSEKYWPWISRISAVYATKGVIYEACRKLPSWAKIQVLNLVTHRLKMQLSCRSSDLY